MAGNQLHYPWIPGEVKIGVHTFMCADVGLCFNGSIIFPGSKCTNSSCRIPGITVVSQNYPLVNKHCNIAIENGLYIYI